MRLLILSALISVMLFGASTTEAEEVYRWVDSRGNVYYSDAEPIDVESVRVVIDETAEEGTVAIIEASVESIPEASTQPPVFIDLVAGDLGPCALARQQLTLLHADVDVFLAENGLWQGSQNGSGISRSWLADASRPNAIRAARNQVLQNCSNPRSVAEEMSNREAALN
jgi:hypothetical protein